MQLRLAHDRHQSPSDEMPNEQARGSDVQGRFSSLSLFHDRQHLTFIAFIGSRREKQVLPEMQLDEPPRDQPAPPAEDPFGIDDMEIPDMLSSRVSLLIQALMLILMLHT